MYACDSFHDNAATEFAAAGLQIAFKVLRTATRSDAPVISVVLFHVPGTSATKARKYLDGLRWLIQYRGAIIRVYVDGHMAGKVAKMGAHDNVEIVQYNAPQFAGKGLFGTMIRLLGLFDFRHNATVNMVSDADRTFTADYYTRALQLVSSPRAEYMFNVLDCVLEGDSFRHIPQQHGLWVLTNMAARRTLPRHLLIYFLADTLRGSSAGLAEWDAYVDRVNLKHGRFGYGLDEYFVNSVMVPAVLSSRKAVYVCVAYWSINTIHYDLYKRTKSPAELTEHQRAVLASIAAGFLGAKASGNLAADFEKIEHAMTAAYKRHFDPPRDMHRKYYRALRDAGSLDSTGLLRYAVDDCIKHAASVGRALFSPLKMNAA